jgi:hypothetical protein
MVHQGNLVVTEAAQAKHQSITFIHGDLDILSNNVNLPCLKTVTGTIVAKGSHIRLPALSYAGSGAWFQGIDIGIDALAVIGGSLVVNENNELCRILEKRRHHGNLVFDAFLKTKITHVAIEFDGSVYPLAAPNRHNDVKMLMKRMGVVLYGPHIEGFRDNHGRFLNREEALIIARIAGQVLTPGNVHGNRLYTEDLW